MTACTSAALPAARWGNVVAALTSQACTHLANSPLPLLCGLPCVSLILCSMWWHKQVLVLSL